MELREFYSCKALQFNTPLKKTNMIKTATLGFPRIGANRELKKAIESYWKNSISADELNKIASEIKRNNWLLQQQNKISHIPCGDFSFYDQILDNIALFGAVPQRFIDSFNSKENEISLEIYFAMARGAQRDGVDVTALEMTKWFDTNYHYLVPEFSKNQSFKLSSSKIFDEFLEAKNLGIKTRPVIIGPVSFLLLGKAIDGSNRLDLLDNLLEVYSQVFERFKSIGVEELQIDEPFLVCDIDSDAIRAYLHAYSSIRKNSAGLKLHLATYFEELGNNAELAFDLGCDSVHIDLVRGSNQLNQALSLVKSEQTLSLGIVDGRNIWINDFESSLATIKKAVESLGSERVIVAPSCQLLHVPVDLAHETKLDFEIKSWLAFATQKLEEINILANAASIDKTGKESIFADKIAANKAAIASRKTSVRIHNQAVKKLTSNISSDLLSRKSNYLERKKFQQSLNLPILPTTTIGSFPQTKEVRKIRADFKSGSISQETYNQFIKEETKKTIKFQEEIGLDVLVHGEFERNDMVEYFGEQLSGFCFTKNGWVQSYGTRCVKPPVIFGDVSRPKAMTVEWAKYAQSLTSKIVKGMLTGPITILQWSFVRNDQSRRDTAMQIAFAIREEVYDLENAGIKIIQIDEAALREGLPIRKSKWNEYLNWAVDAFKITANGVEDRTQIHTHMCYSEFNDIIEAIAKMDADVISIETSRSQMELLRAFVNFKYPNEIGPGVYDIHSPRVPSQEEMENLLRKALDVLDAEQIWVNPDCGLKTRDWPETKLALQNMVAAAKTTRAQLS